MFWVVDWTVVPWLPWIHGTLLAGGHQTYWIIIRQTFVSTTVALAMEEFVAGTYMHECKMRRPL